MNSTEVGERRRRDSTENVRPVPEPDGPEQADAERKPALFISHKHADRTIADALRNWINDCSLGAVTIYQSTFPDNAPRAGAPLNEELRRQLHDSHVVICVFTSPDEDWSYCMWECGVATDPMTEDTRIIVFQFSDAFPPPFQDRVRIDVRQRDDIYKFVKSFLTDPDFFPGRDQAIAPGLLPGAPQIEAKTDDLFGRLADVMPGAIDAWSAWGYLILQFSADELRQVAEAPAGKRVELVEECLRSTTVIREGSKTAQGLFGQAKFPAGLTFAQVLEDWQAEYPQAKDRWVTSVAQQIELAARGRYPSSDWAVMRGATPRGDDWCIPVVTWIRTMPSRDMQFDVYFLPVRGVDEETGRLDLGVEDVPPEDASNAD